MTILSKKELDELAEELRPLIEEYTAMALTEIAAEMRAAASSRYARANRILGRPRRPSRTTGNKA